MLAWALLDAIDGPLVVGALGYVVGAISNAVRDGMSSTAGHRLIAALIIAALVYGCSLILDPIGGALSTAARQRITGQLQARLHLRCHRLRGDRRVLLVAGCSAAGDVAAFQDFSRFSLPAVESVGVAELPSLESEPLAVAALDRAGAAELPGQLPSGHAIEAGSHDELTDTGGRYTELFTLQAQGYR